MAQYFFDLASANVSSLDEEGEELPHIDAAYGEALCALAHAIMDATVQGKSDQQLAVTVRDELGPVLQVTAVFGSTILRKQ